MTTALIVVDVQNDFVSGSLAVPTGESVAQWIGHYLQADPGYDLIVATQDWHVDPGEHFSDSPDYRFSWPVHCVANTHGAALHGALPGFDQRFLKGEYSAAYSGFEGRAATSPHLLDDYLHRHGVTHVDICGIATDYCVEATALDAVRHGFQTRVIAGLCAAVTPETGKRSLAAMEAAGVFIDHWL